jgi:3',5'-cyclic AMP phosphodiesterase CpdA
LQRLAAGGAPVFVILGNHDHYRAGSGPTAPTYESRVAAWRRTCAAAGVRLLERDTALIGDYRIVGCTWWSAIDWNDEPNHPLRSRFASDADFARHAVAEGINDFRMIRGWSVADHVRRHTEDTAWLTDLLVHADDGRKPIVLTHFLPHRATIDAQFRGSSLNAYFTTHRPDLVRHAHVWLFGHTHTHVDLEIDGVRLVANPRGYPGERSGFVADLVLEV